MSRSEDDFLNDEFLKELEMGAERLDELEETGREEEVLSFLDDLDNILKGEKESEDIIMDDLAKETETKAESEFIIPEEINTAMEEGFSFADLFASEEGERKEEAPQEDADVLKILEGLEGIDLASKEDENLFGNEQSDFSALEGFLTESITEANNADEAMMLFGDAESELNFGDNFEEILPEFSELQEEKNETEKKSEKKEGFMSKLGLILFGEDDEDDEFVKGGKNGRSDFIGEASEEDLAMLEDITEKDKKDRKKKEKQEKKEKAKKAKKEKQEKAKKEKEKKAKTKKVKKEKKKKPPKQPDNTPPLPKKPVVLIFLMAASFVALVVLGADLLGYSNQMENAKNQYAKKNYSAAFAEISGMEIKEEDSLLYNKYHVMAMVSAELEAYESLVSKEFYDMALDSLVRTVGRVERYRTDAETYGCIQELNELEAKAEEILKADFDLSKEEALEIYACKSKKEYSTAILKIIKELGLEKVTQ